MNAKTRFRKKFPSKCNKPIVKWYKPHGAIHKVMVQASIIKLWPVFRNEL